MQRVKYLFIHFYVETMAKVIPIHDVSILEKMDEDSHKEYGEERFPTSKEWTDYCAMLREHPYDKISQATPWVLVEEKVSLEDVGKDLNLILAQCETYRMDGELRIEGNSSLGNIFGISVVFVKEKNRNKGYAKKLLELVMKEIEKSETNLQGFLLFSVIGASFYEKFGFLPVDSFEWFVPIEENEKYERNPEIKVS